MIKKAAAVLMAAAMAVSLTGCGSITSGKRIIRISHAQSETHPEHLGLLAFKEYVEERLGDKDEAASYTHLKVTTKGWGGEIWGEEAC